MAAEALFDAGSHVLAGEFHETINQYREIPVRLVALGVIRAETFTGAQSVIQGLAFEIRARVLSARL